MAPSPPARPDLFLFLKLSFSQLQALSSLFPHSGMPFPELLTGRIPSHTECSMKWRVFHPCHDAMFIFIKTHLTIRNFLWCCSLIYCWFPVCSLVWGESTDAVGTHRKALRPPFEETVAKRKWHSLVGDRKDHVPKKGGEMVSRDHLSWENSSWMLRLGALSSRFVWPGYTFRGQVQTGGWSRWVAPTVYLYLRVMVFRTYSFDTAILLIGINPT